MICSQIFSHCIWLRRYLAGQDSTQILRSQDSKENIWGVSQAFSPAFFFCSSCSSKSQRASRLFTVRVRGCRERLLMYDQGVSCTQTSPLAVVSRFQIGVVRLSSAMAHSQALNVSFRCSPTATIRTIFSPISMGPIR